MRRIFVTIFAMFMLTCGAVAQLKSAPDTSSFATKGDIAAEIAARNAAGYVVSGANGQLPSMAGGRASSTLWIPTAPAIDATTAETSCYSSSGVGPGLTIAANAPYAGNKFRLQCNGFYSVPLLNTATLTVKVKWGSTVIASFSATPLPTQANNYPFWIAVTCTIRAPGANGSMVCHGKDDFSIVLTATNILSGPIFNTAATTIDTTTASKLDITATWSSVAGGQIVTSTDGSVEVLY